MEGSWCQMAVFLYGATLTHGLGDFLSHKWRREGRVIVLHCLVYTVFYIPLFWWLDINYWWLVLLFLSHLVIDTNGERILSLLKMSAKAEKNEKLLRFIVFGMDQLLHLLMLFIIALFVFQV